MPKSKTDPIRDDVLDFVRKSEQTLAQATERWSETLRELVPGDGARVRKVVDDVFDFTEKLLENQREFASSVLDAVLGEGAPRRAPAAKRPSTSKRAPAAKRTTKAPKREGSASAA